MLDIVLFREDQGGNPDLVRESQRRRYADITLVDKVIEYDSEWRKSVFPVSAWRGSLNPPLKLPVSLRASDGRPLREHSSRKS